jgi:hypothetical protein
MVCVFILKKKTFRVKNHNDLFLLFHLRMIIQCHKSFIHENQSATAKLMTNVDNEFFLKLIVL